MANTNLKMTVTADAKQAQDSLSSLVTSIAKTTAAVTAASVAAKKVYEVCKELVEIGSQEALAEERLKAVIAATGTAATASYGKMKQLANSISDLTGIEEQSVYAAEKVLVAFGSLNEEGFERTIQLSADVAMAMGTDMASAAQKLGQILATPTQGLDGLKEMGVAFTTQEQEQIKAVYEANGAYEAQALILDKVEKAYGKSATAIGNSSANLLTKINETWTDIKTDLGQGLLDAITPALESLLGILQDISSWVKENTQSASVLNALKDAKKSGASVDYSQWSTIELETALTHAQSNPLQNSVLKSIINDLQGVIDYRRANPNWNVSSISGGTTSYAGTTTSSSTPDWQTFLGSHGSDSNAYQIAQYQAVVDEAKTYLEVLPSYTDEEKEIKKYLSEIISSTEAKIEALKTGVEGVAEVEEEIKETEEEIPEDTTIKDILSSLGSYSESYQADQLAEQINNVKAALDSLANGDPAKTYLQEIYDAMTAVEEESYSLKDALVDIGGSLLDTISSVATSLADIWSNQAEAIKASMEEQEEAGELTVAEKEKMQSEIDELNRRAFETNKANSMAEATISLANTIIGIIEQCNGNPVAVAALSALATASWGAQVASIGSQQYTAMATGGIVTGPTHALIGEAGPEAIIPLKDKRAQEYLGTASPVQINITIEGNADEEVVFNAIERAQKTGMLPSWRYAN
jgi:HJR/Mrr/RecB family endonuclease